MSLGGDTPVGILSSDAVVEIPRDLICNICMDPSVNWKTACADSHSFCGECLQSHIDRCRQNGTRPFCPVCKGDIVYGPNGTLRTDRTLNNVTNDQRVQCPNKCGVIVVLSKLRLHVEKDCTRSIVKCPMHLHGCPFTSDRKGIVEHMKTERHVELAMPFITSSFAELKNQNSALTTEVKDLTSKLTSAVSGISSLKSSIDALVARGVESDKVIGDLTNKIDDLIEDEEVGIHRLVKEVKKNGKKRASPGQGTSARSLREKRQVVSQAAELQRLKALVSAEPEKDAETEDDGHGGASSSTFVSASVSLLSESNESNESAAGSPVAVNRIAAVSRFAGGGRVLHDDDCYDEGDDELVYR